MGLAIDQIEKKRNFDAWLGRFFLFGLFVCIGSLVFYCLIIPNVTGQFCPDIVSGQVPPKAEDIFLHKVFNAIMVEDYEWLSTVSTEKGLENAREIQPLVTQDFEVIGGDDLSGMYERVVQFENGRNVYLVFYGSWPCPDFVVTEQEVIKNLRLDYMEEREGQ